MTYAATTRTAPHPEAGFGIEGLISGTGMIGHALDALREAVWDERADRAAAPRFGTLTHEPATQLAAIHDFIGEPPFEHDPKNVEQDFDALEFDARPDAIGLHAVGSNVRPISRRTVLPPDIFKR